MARREVKAQFQIVVRGQHPSPGPVLGFEELCLYSGLHPELLERFEELGLIEPDVPPRRYRVHVLGRLARIQRLRADLGICFHSMGLVLELLDRVEELEGTVGRLRRRLGEEE